MNVFSWKTLCEKDVCEKRLWSMSRCLNFRQFYMGILLMSSIYGMYSTFAELAP